MSSSTIQSLSLRQAVLININIMIGAGIFINTIPFIKTAGLLSPLIYAFVGLIMMPLIFSVMALLKRFPGGNFYTYAEGTLGKGWAFISTWSYFTAKLASSTLMIHFSVKLIQSVIPIVGALNTYLLDALIISFFTYLNTENIKTGSSIQVMFMTLKLSTVSFVIIASLYALCGKPLLGGTLDFSTLPLSIPQAMYVFAGFEAACSISRFIKDPERNGPRAVMISFFIALIIYVLYQFLFYQMIGSVDLSTQSSIESLPTLLQALHIQTQYIPLMTTLFQLAIASSALGGAYGILFTNHWNLYRLAEKNLVFFSDKLKTLNEYGMPLFCLLAACGLSFIYLLLFQDNNVFLQQINSFGCTITYLISAFSLLKISEKKITPFLGVLSGSFLLLICINAFLKTNYHALVAFSVIVIVGIIGYWHKKRSLSTDL